MKRLSSLMCGLLVVLTVNRRVPAQPSPAAVAAFEAQVASLEQQLAREHLQAVSFVSARSPGPGSVVLEQLSPAQQPAGALVHHWRATAFAPGATAAEFERVLRNFDAYPQRFAPEVLAAHAQGTGDHLQAWLRVRQKHVLTVVLDSEYDVSFGRLDAREGYSSSRSTRIYEIAGAGTAGERRLSATEEHGFLWRLNSYWTYQERDGGLVLQVESVSLSRAIPAGLGWALRPYVESVPRESLEFTLRSACAALRK